MTEQTLFDVSAHVAKPTRKKSANYTDFVEKFKPKLTTDDCYTPPAVYDAVLEWVRENCLIDGLEVLRPFKPGGDFEAEKYGHDTVVIDNPPFSIITRIVRFYMQHGVRFFLFAPYLTLFQPGRHCTSIVAYSDILYENGARVKTSFVSNLFGDIAVMSAPVLRDRIEEAQKSKTIPMPKYVYPSNVMTVSDFAKYSLRHVDFGICRSECEFVRKLDSQTDTAIFGGGYLISDRAAADRAAADRAAAEREVQRKQIIWELSDREREIIKNLK